MNLYLLRQNTNNHYDTYDSCVVIASSTQEASRISPDSGYIWCDKSNSWKCEMSNGEMRTATNYTWVADISLVAVTYLGVADHSLGDVPRVICASFNAG
jgi:hypothetical protein